VRKTSRGFTLIENLTTLGAIALFLAAIVLVIHFSTVNVANAATQNRAAANMAQLIENLETDAGSSVAVFLPAKTALGAMNTAGQEVDFFSMTAQRTPDVVGYLFIPGATGQPGRIQKYVYDKPNGTPTAVGAPLTGFTAMTAQTIEADTLTDPMFGGRPPKRHDYPTGYFGVTAGNHLTDVRLSAVGLNNATETRMVELLPAVMPSGIHVVTARWTPPPTGLTVSPNPLVIVGTGASNARSFVAQDNPFYIGALSVTGSTCGSNASYTPASSTPAGTGGKLPYSVTPNAYGTCTITVADQFGQTAVETVQIAAGGFTTNPAAILFPAPGTALASVPTPHVFNVAEVINGLLGGGVAQAAGSCSTARAYSTWGGSFASSTPAGALTDAQGAAMTDANGCFIEQPRIVARKPGFSGAFQQATTCGTYITGSWLNSQGNGPSATMLLTARAATPAGCAMQVSDGSSSPQSTQLAVVGCGSRQTLENNGACGMPSVGGTNTSTDNGTGGCDPGTEAYSGGSSSTTYGMPPTPYATGTTDVNGNFVVTGNAPGSAYYTITSTTVTYTYTFTGMPRPHCVMYTKNQSNIKNVPFTVWPDLKITKP